MFFECIDPVLKFMFYLLQLGSSLTLRDKEGLTPLDVVMKDRLPHVEFVQSGKVFE